MSRKPKVVSTLKNNKDILYGMRQILLDSNETDGDVYLVKGIMPKGSKVPLHVHEL